MKRSNSKRSWLLRVAVMAVMVVSLISCSGKSHSKKENYGLGGTWVGSFTYYNPWSGFTSCMAWDLHLTLRDTGEVADSYLTPTLVICNAYGSNYWFAGTYTLGNSHFTASVQRAPNQTLFFEGTLEGVYDAASDSLEGTFTDLTVSPPFIGAWYAGRTSGVAGSQAANEPYEVTAP